MEPIVKFLHQLVKFHSLKMLCLPTAAKGVLLPCRLNLQQTLQIAQILLWFLALLRVFGCLFLAIQVQFLLQ
jgi:hypothetical protein